MKALIVYDSFFGNTKQIANALVEALSAFGEAMAVNVNDFSPELLNGVTLLAVGSPTRGFRPTKPISSLTSELSKDTLNGIRVLAFDTRIAARDVNNKLLNILVKIFGYAADPIANKLKKKGGILAQPAEGFYVKESEGPLKDGELERAREWASKAASTV